MISCDDCWSQCYSNCDAFISSSCSDECDGIAYSCDSCYTTVIANCMESSNCTGSCDECNDAPNGSCTSACTTRYCDSCGRGREMECRDNCSKRCSAPNCIPQTPAN
nr:uncharacterized protein LOC127338525 [Lolium perenne]